jgi:diguanylate cyclase (GGDEF)-like protein
MQDSPLAPAPDSPASDEAPSAPSAESQLRDWLQAAAAQRRGDLALGLSYATRAWEAAIALRLYAEQLEAGLLRSHFLFRRAELRGLVDFAALLLPMLREQGASPGLCELLRTSTLAAAEIGAFEAALEFAHEGLAAAQELSDLSAHCMALNAMGVCFERMGDPWQAERLMNEAATLLGDQAGHFERSATQNNLSKVVLGSFLMLQDTGRDAEARKALDRALQYSDAGQPHVLALDDPYVHATTTGNRARALLYAGRVDEAEALLKEAVALHENLHAGGRGQELQCLVVEMLVARGRMRDALDQIEVLLHTAQSAGDGRGTDLTRLHRSAYQAAKALGLTAQALAHLEQWHAADRRRIASQLTAQARFLASRLEAQRKTGFGGRGRVNAPSFDQDPLTGLGNREQLAVRMPEILRQAEANRAPLTVGLVDVDNFKPLRASFGSAVANQVLQTLAQMLRENTRGGDLALRWDTDQFLIVLPETIADRAFEVCERLRVAVETHDWAVIAPGLDVTLSVGLANPPPYATDALILRAKSAVDRAKHLGRNRVALA